jgi:predicted RNase H-like HicB family nuclease
MTKSFTATIEKRGKWYVGYVEGMPGVNSQGRTLKEVSENLREAIALILEAHRSGKPKEPVSKVYKKTILVEA